MKQEITFEDYNKVEIRIGTVLKVSKNEKAKKPYLVVDVDFGTKTGIKNTINKVFFIFLYLFLELF